ncbi:MAG: response regulator [Deltaproteobacteria bacterium]|nr:response regulator [Deltaproteobacteria bacterium]
MKRILIVDDENAFRLSLADGLRAYSDRFEVLSAETGAKAISLLQTKQVDLVLTDLKMPEMDGFELISWMSRSRPSVPVIAMTAYGTPEIEAQLERHGVTRCLDKPLDLKVVAETIQDELDSDSSGFVHGFPLATFLQLIGMEKKSCTLTISSEGRVGALHLLKGDLVAAETRDLHGIEAAYDIVAWEKPAIEMARLAWRQDRQVHESLNHVLMEAFRLQDERERSAARAAHESPSNGEGMSAKVSPITKEKAMALEKHLQSLREIKGYKASGVMNFTGESLIVDSSDPNIDLALVGATFNDIFRSAHDASKKIGLDACKETIITTPKGVVVMRCTGTDAKAHLHIIGILAADGNQALMKMQIEKMVGPVIDEVAG